MDIGLPRNKVKDGPITIYYADIFIYDHRFALPNELFLAIAIHRRQHKRESVASWSS